MESSPDETPAFAETLRRAKTGDERALTEILQMAEGRLQRYADGRLGSRLRASLRHSDVLQNAYVEMLRSLDRFEGTNLDEFVAWVGKIIEHDIQRQNRWFGAEKRSAPERTSERNMLARILLESPPTPSAEVSVSENRRIVHEALACLSDDHAQIIRLAIFEGLPHSEIAKRLGRSDPACRMLLTRARAALAMELEKRVDR